MKRSEYRTISAVFNLYFPAAPHGVMHYSVNGVYISGNIYNPDLNIWLTVSDFSVFNPHWKLYALP